MGTNKRLNTLIFLQDTVLPITFCQSICTLPHCINIMASKGNRAVMKGMNDLEENHKEVMIVTCFLCLLPLAFLTYWLVLCFRASLAQMFV